MEDASVENMREERMELPPGFRFHPTDEEIITHYLSPKVVNPNFVARAIGEVDLNKCEPWDLPSKAKMGEKEWYFFCQKGRKYPTGVRTNRATGAGYWKATGKDKEIYRGTGTLVGMKKTLVFYRGRAPKGEKTNWVMHEFRLEGTLSYSNLSKSSKDEWVVSRVFHKNIGIKRSPVHGLESINSLGDNHLLDTTTVSPLRDSTNFNPFSSYIDDKSFEIKAIPTSSSSTPSHFNTMIGMDNTPHGINYQVNYGNYPTHSSSVPLIYPPVRRSGSFFSFPGLIDMDHLHHEEAMRRQWKVEQRVNQPMVSTSRETGLSTDHNTEISSVISKHYDDLDGPSSSEPVIDIDNMWKY